MPLSSPQPRRAFTLVELLVVIGIIAVLIGVLLPALSRARAQAKMLVEMSAARQLATAYLAYSNTNRGQLIPGHYTGFSYNDKVYDNFGRIEVSGEPIRRWPWRLVANTRYNPTGSILTGERAEFFGDPQRFASYTLDYQYNVSLTPSFGLNMYALGGELQPGTGPTAGQWVPVLGTDSFCVRRAGQVKNPAQQIVFVSARGAGVDGPSEGFFKLNPPTWNSAYALDRRWDAGNYDPAKDPVAWGFVHPRWRGKAVTAFFDGHVDSLSLKELRDTRLWYQQAAKEANADWLPPLP